MPTNSKEDAKAKADKEPKANAKPKGEAQPKGDAKQREAETPVVSALNSPAGREWLASELAGAERWEQHGPDGSGWQHNESMRTEIVERAEFLRALTALITEAAPAES